MKLIVADDQECVVDEFELPDDFDVMSKVGGQALLKQLREMAQLYRQLRAEELAAQTEEDLEPVETPTPKSKRRRKPDVPESLH